LALGIGLAALGLVGYLVQVQAMQRLIAPWYVPFAATLGVIFVVVSLFQRRSVTRVLVLLLLVVLAGAEWTFLLGARLPAYTGPVEVGQKFPQFKTTRADGTSFAQQDLEGGSNTVMVFFRGRW
jgi:FtsH-binding integral membrane protein